MSDSTASESTTSEFMTCESTVSPSDGRNVRERKTTVSRTMKQGRTCYLPPARRFEAFSPEVRESILKNLQEKTQKVLENHPDGVSISEFISAYKKEFGKNLDVQAFGFMAHTECFDKIPGLKVVERNNRRQYIVSTLVDTSCKQPIANIPESKVDSEKILFPNSSLLFHQSDVRLVNDLTLAFQQKNAMAFIAPPTPRRSTSKDISKFTAATDATCLQSCSDTARLERERKWKLVIPTTTEGKPDAILADIDIDCVENMEVAIFGIRQMLRAHPMGIPLFDVTHRYFWNSGEMLSPRIFKFKNIKKMLLSIVNDVPLRIVKIDGDPTVYFRVDMSPPPIPASPDPTVPLIKGIPKDAAITRETYAKQDMFLVSDTAFFPVCVLQVYTPGDIWIQLLENGADVGLVELSKKLNELYNSREGNYYSMKNKHIVRDAVCAGMYFGDVWCRCVITDASSDSSCVEVFQVDHGTKAKVQKENLRYLRKRFLALPAQGIQIRMALLQPKYNVMDTWDKRAEFRLNDIAKTKSMTTGKKLMAQLSRNSMYPGRLSLWLCDYSGENIVHLNKILVDEGLAKYSQEEIDKTAFLPCFPASPSFKRTTTGVSRFSAPHQDFKRNNVEIWLNTHSAIM